MQCRRRVAGGQRSRVLLMAGHQALPTRSAGRSNSRFAYIRANGSYWLRYRRRCTGGFLYLPDPKACSFVKLRVLGGRSALSTMDTKSYEGNSLNEILAVP